MRRQEASTVESVRCLRKHCGSCEGKRSRGGRERGEREGETGREGEGDREGGKGRREREGQREGGGRDR